jgi:hypothetical protein
MALRLVSLSATLSAAALTIGCSIGDASDPMLATVDTLPGGTIHVTIDPGARARVPEWRLVEDLRIGVIDGSGPDAFGAARSIAVDDEGRIYVLDAQAQDIRIFGPDGAHLRTVGRKGGGPGEFQRANGLALGPDGVVYVYDNANQRLTALHRGGDSVSTQPLLSAHYGWVWDGRVDAQGRLHERVHVVGEEGDFIRRVDVATGRADTFAITMSDSDRPVSVSARTERGGGVTSVGYTPGLERRFAPDGAPWSAFTARYAVRQLDLETGDTLRIIEFAAPPVPVSDAERSAEIARIDSFISRFGATWDHSLVPRQKPPIEHFDFDASGRLWVRVPSPDSLVRFDVLEPEGRLVAAVTSTHPWSRYETQLVLREDAVYGIVRDELDVQYIVRARIERED